MPEITTTVHEWPGRRALLGAQLDRVLIGALIPVVHPINNVLQVGRSTVTFHALGPDRFFLGGGVGGGCSSTLRCVLCVTASDPTRCARLDTRPCRARIGTVDPMPCRTILFLILFSILFLGPSRMILGWIVDGVGHVRYNPTPTCTRTRISAFDHRPSDSTYTNPHGHTMVSFPRSSESDRYYVTFYASRDLYGTTLRHTDWRNQVHVQAFSGAGTTRHVAKLAANEQFTATGTTGGDIVFTVVSIGSDTADVEIRRSGEPNCVTSAPSLGTTTPAPSMAGTPAGDLTCGETFTGSTVGAPSILGRSSGGHFFALEVASDGTTITVSACGSEYDTFLRVYTGSNINTIESSDLVTSDDDGCSETASQLTHTFPAGSYTVILDGFGSFEGTYTITAIGSTCPTLAPTYCPEGYSDYGTRYNWGMGRITIVTTHKQCSDRCTEFSGAQFSGGCKAYMTGMYFGMLFCRSYGGNFRTQPCAPWAIPTDPGEGSGQLGSVHANTNQENIGGNCCSNSTFVGA